MKETIKRFFQKLPGKIKMTLFYATLAYVLVSGALFWFGRNLVAGYQQSKVAEQKQKEDIKVGQFALAAMELTNTKLSDLQRQTLAQAIVKVSGDVFTNYTDRTTFVTLISNESAFNREIRSPAGAVGLTQVMPQYVNEFAALCSMGKVNPEDLTDVNTNLMLGACLFRELIEDLHGNVALALGAYNAGKNSLALKEMRGLRAISNVETKDYIVRYVYRHGEIENVVKNDPPKYEVKFEVPNLTPKETLATIEKTSETVTITPVVSEKPAKAKAKKKDHK